MSTTGRMENDGMSFEDAKMKESLNLVASTGDDLAMFADAKLLARIEAQDKRFAEHLAAWKANNAYHAQRIAELEKLIHPEVLAAMEKGPVQAFSPACGFLPGYEVKR